MDAHPACYLLIRGTPSAYLDSICGAHSDDGGHLASSLIIHRLMEVTAEEDQCHGNAHDQAADLGSGADGWHHHNFLGLWPHLQAAAEPSWS